MAPEDLLFEKVPAEAKYAEVKRKMDELLCCYRFQEQQALAELSAKSKAITAEFERQKAEIAAQLNLSLPESINRALSRNRELEIEMLQRTHQEQANARKRWYD